MKFMFILIYSHSYFNFIDHFFSDTSLQQLSTWDPASEAFQNEKFNSYIKPESGVDVLKSFRSKKEYDFFLKLMISFMLCEFSSTFIAECNK